MGFVYRSVNIVPFVSFVILTSRKFTDDSLMSAVNLTVLWNEFKASEKEYNSSRECCHMMKMSSMYLHHTSGIKLLVDRKSLSSLSMNRIA